MSDSSQQVPIDEATHEVALASRRVALLHIAYARMLVDEFGPERGREMIGEAIRAYGQRIGDEVRAAVEAQGLDPTPENYGAGSSRQLPAFGMCASVKHADVDGERRLRVHGCVMGEAWREIGEADLGRLYCLVDAAKHIAYDGTHTLAHAATTPDGDDYCEFCLRRATPREIEAFDNHDRAWVNADRCDPEDS